MQGMLDNLSQPVAFATVPLGVDDTRTQSGMAKPTLQRKDDEDNTDTEIDEPIFARLSRRIGIGREALKSSPAEAYRPSLSSDDFEDVDELLEKGRVCSNIILFSSSSLCRRRIVRLLLPCPNGFGTFTGSTETRKCKIEK